MKLHNRKKNQWPSRVLVKLVRFCPRCEGKPLLVTTKNKQKGLDTTMGVQPFLLTCEPHRTPKARG